MPQQRLLEQPVKKRVRDWRALGLTPEGTGEKFVLDGNNTYGGKVVTNPSGGSTFLSGLIEPFVGLGRPGVPGVAIRPLPFMAH
ncbi:hypothetical protein P1P70_37340, partial [Streptomyces sp. MB09-02B]|nr:hypothetical protein [Streptomyces sp. MB09-02B]